MVADMTESTLRIKRKEEAYFSGQTGESMMEDGSVENNTGKAIIFQSVDSKERVYGNMVKD
jgi:hypothetical protein